MSDFFSQTFKPFSYNSTLYPSSSADNDDITRPDDVSCQYYTAENIHTHKPSISSSSLSLFHLNAGSLNKKANDLADYIASLPNHFDIYGISETWFKSNDDASLIDFPGYSVENIIRQNRNGGGVSLSLLTVILITLSEPTCLLIVLTVILCS